MKQERFDIEDIIENELLAKALSDVEQGLDEKAVLEGLKNGNKRAVSIIAGELAKQNREPDVEKLKVKLARQVTRRAQDTPDIYNLTIENFADLILQIEKKLGAS